MEVPHLVGEDFSIDTSKKGPLKFSSAKLRQNLIDELAKPSYDEHVGAMRGRNEILANQIAAITYNRRSAPDGPADDADELLNPSRRNMVIDFIILLLLRLRNGKVFHFWTAALSLFAYRCRVPKMFWAVLCALGLLLSHPVTHSIALDLGTQLTPQSHRDLPTGAVGGLACFDNCEKYRRTNMQHAAAGRQNDMIKVNNWYFLKNAYLMSSDLRFSLKGECASPLR